MATVTVDMAATTRPALGESSVATITARTLATMVERIGTVHPDLRVHDVAQVIDDPGQQVGPTAAAKTCRGEWDQPCVCRGASVGEVGQGYVVRAQALPVAKDRPGHAEGAHGHDRRQQHEDDRAFAGADDQPAGGGGQGDARRGRDTAKQPGAQNRPDPSDACACRGRRDAWDSGWGDGWGLSGFTAGRGD